MHRNLTALMLERHRLYLAQCRRPLTGAEVARLAVLDRNLSGPVL